jgi:predicted dehydrogenase
LGGYGDVYLAALLDQPDRRVAGRELRLVGAVDPAPAACRRLAELGRRRIPLHRSLAEFYHGHRADLAIISSPIHHHCRQTCRALEAGSAVLCEKPAAATIQDVERMIAAETRADRLVGVGFQWSFTTPIQQLKRDIQSGRFGAPQRMKCLCLWPRDAAYYGRNDWAGRYRDAHGNWILDGPINNAMAHDLHNMLYLLGPEMHTSAQPVVLEAELYRANPIETCDTAALRIRTAGDAELLFYASHATREVCDPIFHLECERATITFPGGDQPITARFRDNATTVYASPHSEPHAHKVWTCLAAIAGRAVLPCGLAAARAHTLCVNGAHEMQPVQFPGDLIRQTDAGGQQLTWVTSLAESLQRCYARNTLPSEADLPWAQPASPTDLHDYGWYPGGRRPAE